MTGAPTRGTVLVVDDEVALVRVLAMHLTNEGYEVLTATGGEAALGQIQHRHPDLVVLDVMMPEMSGLEVCRQIRADPSTRAIKVIVLTASSSFHDSARAAGADGFITKPFGLGALTESVASLLDRGGEVGAIT